MIIISTRANGMLRVKKFFIFKKMVLKLTGDFMSVTC